MNYFINYADFRRLKILQCPFNKLQSSKIKIYFLLFFVLHPVKNNEISTFVGKTCNLQSKTKLSRISGSLPPEVFFYFHFSRSASGLLSFFLFCFVLCFFFQTKNSHQTKRVKWSLFINGLMFGNLPVISYYDCPRWWHFLSLPLLFFLLPNCSNARMIDQTRFIQSEVGYPKHRVVFWLPPYIRVA